MNINTNSNKLYCLYCNRIFKNKMNLDKHSNLCQLIDKSKNPELYDDKDTTIPSRKIMYKMLLELANKYTILEEKYEALNKRIPEQIKKINVITWLNENSKPQFGFNQLSDNIQINNSMITELFNNNNFFDLFDKVLSSSFHSDFPIVVFEKSPHKFYGYLEDDGWRIICKEELRKFLNKLHIKICKHFHEWKKNCHRTDDTFYITCDKINIQLMSIDFKENESIFTKAKTILSKNIKQNLISTIEYEFEY